MRNVFISCLIIVLFMGCASGSHTGVAGATFSDEEVKQFCLLRDRVRGNLQKQGEVLAKDLLRAHQVSEERFGVLISAQLRDSSVQISPKEHKLLEELKTANAALAEHDAKRKDEIVRSSGMRLKLYHDMLDTYNKSTDFQNRVYRSCAEK